MGPTLYFRRCSRYSTLHGRRGRAQHAAARPAKACVIVFARCYHAHAAHASLLYLAGDAPDGPDARACTAQGPPAHRNTNLSRRAPQQIAGDRAAPPAETAAIASLLAWPRAWEIGRRLA